MQFAFFKGSECQQTPAGPCGHLSVFFPPQSNRFRSRDGTAVVFQKMFMPFGHHPVIPDGLCYKLTHLEELPWIHFIWVILCYKTLSIEKCVGMKKLKGDSNDFSGNEKRGSQVIGQIFVLGVLNHILVIILYHPP